MSDARPDDILLGRIAVETGAITEDRLTEALAAQEGGDARPLGEILVSRGWIAPARLAELLAAQRERLLAIDPRRGRRRLQSIFGKLAVRLGHATPDQINRALRRQAREVVEGRSVPLGRILVDMRALSDSQVEEILEIQRTRLCACADCGHFYDLRSFDSPDAAVCRRCGGPMLLPETLAAMESAADAAPAPAPGALPLTQSGLFGAVALARGYVTPRQLDEALVEQAREASGTGEKPGVPRARLGDVLVDKGWLDEARRDEVAALQREILSRTTHPRFGQEAVRRGWITEGQLQETLRLQASAAAIGYVQPLGAVLVQRRLLTLGQVEEILRTRPGGGERAERLKRIRQDFRRRLRARRATGTALWAVGAAAALAAFVLIAIPSRRPSKPERRTASVAAGDKLPAPESWDEAVAGAPATPGFPIRPAHGVETERSYISTAAEPEAHRQVAPTPDAADLRDPALPDDAVTPVERPTAVVTPAAAVPVVQPSVPPAGSRSVTAPLSPPSRTAALYVPADPTFFRPVKPVDFEAESRVHALARRYDREIRTMAADDGRTGAVDAHLRDLEECVRKYAGASSRYAQLWGYAALNLQASALKREGRHREAATALEHLVSRYPSAYRSLPDSPLGNGALLPSWLGAHRNLAATLQYGVQDAERAMAAYQALVTRFPGTEEADVAWDFIGSYWEERGEYDRAEDAYRRIRSLGAEYVAAWCDACRRKKSKRNELARAIAMVERRDFASALAYMEESFRGEPLNGEPDFWSGVALQGLGRNAEAAARFKRYLSEHPLGPLASQARKRLRVDSR